ncbi:MAG: transglycosylase SLT domain-containing protein, partial [Proteobacteria bacterium]|nr:transglycosylase SLT domain-containing protein [Pseudomonadota bacterium]
ARSFAGAIGLFQLLPRTAKQLGFDRDDLVIPEKSVQAGIKYLDWTRDRFSETLPIEERFWFSLAAYNAGFGHVRDARRLAKQKGWNPDSWFDNVERAILLLSKKEYYRKARFGYCRGSETAKYVSDIRNRYQAYVDLAQTQ